MDLELIERTLDLLTPEETRAVLSFIEGCEEKGTIRHADAEEWRRRILARQPWPTAEPTTAPGK
jgi:hypothetical protein